MEKPIEKEKRVSKSTRYFEIYLEYVKMHSILKLNWTIQRKHATEIESIWTNMTEKLNCCGGAVRDVTHWKKVFTEWKSHTRRKLKHNKPLNDIEKQLVDLTGLTCNPERPKNPPPNVKNHIIRKPSSQTIEKCPTIKEEIEDSSSDTSFIEQEARNSCEGITTITNGNLQGGDIREKPKQMNSISQERLEEASKGYQQSNSSTQVSQEMLGIPSVSIAILSLANAINRYCDIVERRIF